MSIKAERGAVAMLVASPRRFHVAPWRSVFKLHLLLDTDVTFLLTSGGHNAGIVSEPARSDRRYRVRKKSERDPYLDPDAWVRETPSSAVRGGRRGYTGLPSGQAHRWLPRRRAERVSRRWPMRPARTCSSRRTREPGRVCRRKRRFSHETDPYVGAHS